MPYCKVMTQPALHIAMLEDHPLTRSGVKMALMPDYIIELEASTAGEFFSLLKDSHIDLLLLDINLPDSSGVDVARRLRQERPEIKILVFSVDVSEETINQLLGINVEGIVCKLSDEKALLKAVKTIQEGGNFYLEDAEKLERDILIAKSVTKPSTALTEREKAVLLACCKGMTDAEAADALCLSVRTVENHKFHIFRKWNINNSVEMLRYAIRSGIVKP